MLGSRNPTSTEIRRPRCVETSSLGPAQACSAVRGSRWSAAVLLVGALALGLTLGCKPKPGDRCEKGTALCQDPATELACQSGKYIASPCRGPAGCAQKGSDILCDASANTAGDPCSTDDENKGGCSGDKKRQIACRSGSYAVVPCLGPAGCRETATGSECDHSIAQVGDACDTTGQACSVDATALLACTDKKWVVDVSCRGPKACRDVGEKLLCDNSRALLGDGCDTTGRACSVDGKAMLECKEKKFQVDSPCRGPEGCHDAGDDKVTCDMSHAEIGDVCEQGSACSADQKSMLTCKEGKFALDVKCPRRCVVQGDTVRCGA